MFLLKVYTRERMPHKRARYCVVHESVRARNKLPNEEPQREKVRTPVYLFKKQTESSRVREFESSREK
jgi:hypothetical protein